MGSGIKRVETVEFRSEALHDIVLLSRNSLTAANSGNLQNDYGRFFDAITKTNDISSNAVRKLWLELTGKPKAEIAAMKKDLDQKDKVPEEKIAATFVKRKKLAPLEGENIAKRISETGEIDEAYLTKLLLERESGKKSAGISR